MLKRYNHLEEIHIYKATADPDTLYYHEAMKKPDADRFREAMAKEWDDQDNNNNFTITPISDVPEGEPILPMPRWFDGALSDSLSSSRC